LFLVVTCGTATLIRFANSLESWLPAAVVLLPCRLILLQLLPVLDVESLILIQLKGASFVLAVITPGGFLLVLNVRRIKDKDISLSVAVYHLTMWFHCVYLSRVCLASPSLSPWW